MVELRYNHGPPGERRERHSSVSSASAMRLLIRHLLSGNNVSDLAASILGKGSVLSNRTMRLERVCRRTRPCEG